MRSKDYLMLRSAQKGAPRSTQRRRDRLSAAFDRAIDEIRDVQIAGIAAARKATLATRHTGHFADLGITLVDPWHF
jgi:predicted nucleic acid-binding protein